MSEKQQHLWAGILFIALGTGTFLLSLQYRLWVGGQVGSGLFPSIVGAVLAVLGVIVFVQSFGATGEGAGPWKVRPILAICGAVLAFALLVDRVGTLAALAAAALMAGFADKPNFKYLAIVYAVIVAFVYFFLMGVINLPYQLF